jgi:NAD(P)-dependent dehydrogenase (short-subunit alcohol dehydrogenase family)
MNERPRLILVTGAAGDLGAAAVRAALTDGIRVVATDRDAAGLARLADVPGLTRCVLDVTSAEQWADVADRVAGLGKLDGFFNNAGIVGPTASIESTPDEDFDATIAVNVRGTYLGLKHVTPLLRDGAAIVNTSSVAGVIGFPIALPTWQRSTR